MADFPASSGPSPSHVRRSIVRDSRFQRLLLGHMLSLAEGEGGQQLLRRWTPKACALVLNGLSHLLRDAGDLSDIHDFRRLVGFVADALVHQGPEGGLAPRHVSLSLNALARLLPLLVDGAGGDNPTAGGGGEWGLFVSVMVAR